MSQRAAAMQAEAMAILDDIKTAQVGQRFAARMSRDMSRVQVAGSSSIALLRSQPGTSEIER